MNALDALYRCQRAWERSQPQLFWTDEVLFDGLEEREACRPALLEPAIASHRRGTGGLNPGAEPCCDELTAIQTAAPSPSTLISPERQRRVGAFIRGMDEQVVTGACDSGTQSTSSASPERALPARGKRVGGAPSPGCGQPPDSVTPCAPLTTTGPDANPPRFERPAQEVRV